jgi:hypothetical protein
MIRCLRLKDGIIGTSNNPFVNEATPGYRLCRMGLTEVECEYRRDQDLAVFAYRDGKLGPGSAYIDLTKVKFNKSAAALVIKQACNYPKYRELLNEARRDGAIE